jgi:hypothetical protein
MSDKGLSSSIVWLIDVPFAIEKALVGRKRSWIFNCVSIVCPHYHMGGLQGEVEWGAQFLHIFEPLYQSR